VKRMRKIGSHIIITALLCFGGAIGAAGTDGSDTAGTGAGPLRLSGFWSIETGQMANYMFLSHQIAHQDLLRTYFNFGISKQLTPNLKINAFAEGKLYYDTFDKQYIGGVESFNIPGMWYSFYFDQMDAEYTFGDAAAPPLQLTLGYFPFKYNPDARDLGEYLYRSGTYPAFIINNFDYAQARLAGLKVTSNLFGMLHQDLLLTMETDYPPFFDLNAGYIVSCDFAKILQLGAGGMYQSLIPANSKLTTPPDENNNGYLLNPVYNDTTGTYSGTIAYYTYAGLKLMARFSFDPKRLFNTSTDDFGILGQEDLKIYGEGAILGVENYPASKISTNPNPWGYDTLLHKIPLMAGFNIPTFKLLDVLTAEVEWYGCTYPNNDQYKGEQEPFPVPVSPSANSGVGVSDFNYAVTDNWKWAVYAKKSFKCGAYLVGQVARDHIRNETPLMSTVDREEALRALQAWFWEIKVGYQF
jgi:hypothetical protein